MAAGDICDISDKSLQEGVRWMGFVALVAFVAVYGVDHGPIR